MSLQQGLQILVLVQFSFQILFWYVWLVRFAQMPDNVSGTLAIGSVVLLVSSMVPVSFLIVSLIRTFQSRPSTLWFGLGCTVATVLSNIAMVRVSNLRFLHLDLIQHFRFT
jgi:fucose 4-O-acetylase-like acetyltransferase